MSPILAKGSCFLPTDYLIWVTISQIRDGIYSSGQWEWEKECLVFSLDANRQKSPPDADFQEIILQLMYMIFCSLYISNKMARP